MVYHWIHNDSLWSVWVAFTTFAVMLYCFSIVVHSYHIMVTSHVRWSVTVWPRWASVVDADGLTSIWSKGICNLCDDDVDRSIHFGMPPVYCDSDVTMIIGHNMMMSSNGNIFRVTGPLCGEFTGPGEFPAQRPVTRSFDVFFDLRLNKRLSKQPRGWCFETPTWSLWRQCH